MSAGPGERRPLAMVGDYRAGTMTVLFTDGREAVVPNQKPLPATNAVARSVWFPDLALLLLSTTSDEDVLVELPRPGDASPRAGRPTIYLDQNQWSVLAKTIYQPERVDARSREAARHLVDLARGGKVILPLSGAHMVETCQWRDDRARYELALTMAQLSRGWQMCNPFDVRQRELVSALQASTGKPVSAMPAVVTLESVLLRSSGRGAESKEPLAGLPPDWRLMGGAVLMACTVFATMLDAEPVEREHVPGWALHKQRFADWLVSQSSSRELRRARADGFFVVDLGDELIDAANLAGVTSEELNDWAFRRGGTVAGLPALGLCREVMFEKLVNTGARWEENDLFDLMYLTCAAGYADYVVAERHWAAMMRQGLRRLGRPVTVYARLFELVEDLDGGLVGAA